MTRADSLYTTAVLAEFFGVPTSTIRRWAYEDGWTQWGSRSVRLWDIYEVGKSWGQRHGPKEPAKKK